MRQIDKITHSTTPRNITLAFGYGTGKKSIMLKIIRLLSNNKTFNSMECLTVCSLYEGGMVSDYTFRLAKHPLEQ